MSCVPNRSVVTNIVVCMFFECFGAKGERDFHSVRERRPSLDTTAGRERNRKFLININETHRTTPSPAPSSLKTNDVFKFFTGVPGRQNDNLIQPCRIHARASPARSPLPPPPNGTPGWNSAPCRMCTRAHASTDNVICIFYYVCRQTRWHRIVS